MTIKLAFEALNERDAAQMEALLGSMSEANQSKMQALMEKAK